MLWLLTGSIPGVLLGSHFSVRVPDRELRVGFGVILVLSGLKLIPVPQANYVVGIGLGVALTVTLLWWLYTRRVSRLRRLEAQQAA
jgi:hypothetical protein